MYKSMVALVLTVLVSVAGSGAQAQSVSHSLTAVANHNGYNVQWLLPERAVRLYRPGIVIVIRPGATMYEVNNRVEFADAAPQYVNGDMLVSTSLAARLARLAFIAAASQAPMHEVRFEQTLPPVSGAITLDVRPQQGSAAVNVSGHAPPAVPVTITLLATISHELPTILLSRNDIQPDSNGQFQASITIGPDYQAGTLIKVVATSAPGVTPASATITVGAPNAGVSIPSDKPYCPSDLPPDMCPTTH